MYRATIHWYDRHGSRHCTVLNCPTWGEALNYQRMPRLNGWVTVEFVPQ